MGGCPKILSFVRHWVGDSKLDLANDASVSPDREFQFRDRAD